MTTGPSAAETAAPLCGHLGLGKVIAFYDDNGISIDGEIDGWFTDDTPARFEAYGWQVIDNVDGHDPSAVAAAPINVSSKVFKRKAFLMNGMDLTGKIIINGCLPLMTMET